MRHLFSSPLGACSAPFGFSRKESGIGAAALAAGIAATASTVNSAMNNYAADLTSDRQFYRTQDLMKMQRDIDMGKWREQVAYNTPEAEMQRYREAGLNPFLLSREGMVGSGSSQSVPSGSAPSVPLGQTFPNSFDSVGRNVADLLSVSSQIKRNEAESFSKVVDSISKVGSDLGWDNARSVARSMLGIYGIKNSQRERQLDSLVDSFEYDAKIKRVQSDVAQQTSMQYANNLISLQNMEFAKYSAEFNLMQSEVESNRSKIRVAASEYIRNIADALHLKKVGDYYEANAVTVNALRDLTREALQYKVNSLKRQDITEQTIFDAQKALRSHIREEGFENPQNNKFIENWNIDNDPFYNEVNKILGSFHISTNVGFSGSYGSKDVYGHGFGY